jgi:thymidylate kinase
VVSDRWTTDALVDLNVRYGRHRPAEWLLRALAPRADVSVLLDIDAQTAAARKPDDQPKAVLDTMEELYRGAARRTGVRRIDATRPREEVVDELLALVDGAVASGRAAAPHGA